MITFVCYTHSDYKDIWPLVFGQIKKYVNIPKVLFVNKNEEKIDNSVEEEKQHVSPPSLPSNNIVNNIDDDTDDDDLSISDEPLITANEVNDLQLAIVASLTSNYAR